MPYMTVIKSTKPATLGKRFERSAEGKITKSVVANVSKGKAKALSVQTAEELAEVLRSVCKQSNVALMSGRFIGANEKETVNLVTERKLAELIDFEVKDVPDEVQVFDGKTYAARLKRCIEPGCWVLIDADNPAGIPDEWAARSLRHRLEMLEALVPGISTCTRVEYRSSSARVVQEGEDPSGATHAWMQVSDASKLDWMREHVRVQMQLQDLSFPSPRYSNETGEVIGHEARTVIDLAVWVSGRLVFCSEPDVQIDDYYVADAGVAIVNPDGGVLDMSSFTVPTEIALQMLRKKTGQNLSFATTGCSLTVKDHSSLSWNTPIEIKGVTRSLREVVEKIEPNKKVRCETPFRASQSEAAFIRILDDGLPMLHDVGTSTSYFLPAEEETAVHNGSGGPQWLQEFNAKYAWVEAPKSIYRFEFSDYIKQGELATQYKNDPLIVQSDDGNEKRYCRVAAWLSDKNRAQYRDLVFDPGEPPITSKNEINTWKGFAIAPISGCITPYETLRDHLFPDPQQRCYVEQWLAHKLKHPGVKMNTALVIWSSAEGVGKNLLFETVGEIIGPRHACVIGQKDLVGNFNSWAKNRLYVIGDEVLSNGDRRDADQFKGLITGTMLRINEKNQPEYDIANYTSFVFLSNHGDAVHLEDGNRRYFVADIKANPLHPQFYKDYAAWRDTIGLAALHNYLINDVDLMGFDPKAPAPITDAKHAMVSAGRSGLEQWMADVMEDPVATFGAEVVTSSILKSAYQLATSDNRSTPKAIVNAAKKTGAQVRPSQIRVSNVKGSPKVRVISLANHDDWAARPEAEWAEELCRAQKLRLST
ncbi:primase-helicase family protein [Yoonia sp.]|uniref:primase-helicase family protein n=1 Tax=Yoonia sp. TaxID=2212373 RepID=UPI004048CF6C